MLNSVYPQIVSENLREDIKFSQLVKDSLFGTFYNFMPIKIIVRCCYISMFKMILKHLGAQRENSFDLFYSCLGNQATLV